MGSSNLIVDLLFHFSVLGADILVQSFSFLMTVLIDLMQFNISRTFMADFLK